MAPSINGESPAIPPAAWKVYLSGLLAVLLAFVPWMSAHVIMGTQIEASWWRHLGGTTFEEHGRIHPMPPSMLLVRKLQEVNALVSNYFWILAAGVVLIFVLLERWKPWPRYRRRVVAGLVMLAYLGTIFSLWWLALGATLVLNVLEQQ